MARESVKDRTVRAAKIVAGLKKPYPEAHCALEHDSALELLVATILSAQSTDVTVNQVTPTLFKTYKTAADYAKADPARFEEQIHSTGFFRQKTKSVLGMARMLVDAFDGHVPDRMDALVRLPGVARKTANVVLGTWFGRNDGIVVDTHVGRLAHRLGLTPKSKNEKDAVRIEQDLQVVVARSEWTYFSHALIWHGRKVCTARKPNCGACTLAPLCPAAFSFDTQPPGSPRAKVGTRSNRRIAAQTR